MSELTALQERLAGLIASLSPAARRQMAADIAKKLRASQQQRIRRQQAPDGTPYAARKRQPVRSKKGRIRREMFARLRTNRFMKAKGSDSAAVWNLPAGYSAWRGCISMASKTGQIVTAGMYSTRRARCSVSPATMSR